MILENLHMGITLDMVADLFRWISAFAVQTTDELGGIRAVARLAIIGFVIGLLACIAYGKITFIER